MSVFNEETTLPVRSTEVSYGFWLLHCSPPWEKVRLSAVPRRAWVKMPELLGRARTRFGPYHQQEKSNIRHGDAKKDEEEVGKQIKDSWKAEVGRRW